MFKKKPKIVQISCNGKALYGLGSDGRPYCWSVRQNMWASIIPFGRPIEVIKPKRVE